MDFDRAVRSVVDQITEELRDRAVADVNALRAAGRLSWDGLLAVLADRSAGEDRLRAAWLLGRLDGSALAPLLIALADPDHALRAEAARALGSLDSPEAIPALVQALRHDADAATREAAAWALGLIGTDDVIDPLLESLADSAETPSVRGQAAESLSGARNARAIPSLIAALDDPSPEVRYWAAFALGELSAQDALPALERLAANDTAIADRHGSVADEARAAIAIIRSDDGVHE
jgi:HEAT repeat protein